MTTFFLQRQYPEKILLDSLNKVQNISREETLKTKDNHNTKDRPIVSLLYHPLVHRVRNIILNNWSLLQSREEVANIFTQPPLIAFKRDSNIRDMLVRSKLHRSSNRATVPTAKRVRSSAHPPSSMENMLT